MGRISENAPNMMCFESCQNAKLLAAILLSEQVRVSGSCDNYLWYALLLTALTNNHAHEHSFQLPLHAACILVLELMIWQPGSCFDMLPMLWLRKAGVSEKE